VEVERAFSRDVLEPHQSSAPLEVVEETPHRGLGESSAKERGREVTAAVLPQLGPAAPVGDGEQPAQDPAAEVGVEATSTSTRAVEPYARSAGKSIHGS